MPDLEAVTRRLTAEEIPFTGSELDGTGTGVANYTTLRWAAAAQNDFANRVRWSLESTKRPDANHAPSVSVLARNSTTVHPGETVTLRGLAVDTDQDALSTRWWQYREEGTYPGAVTVADASAPTTTRLHPRGRQVRADDLAHLPGDRRRRVSVDEVRADHPDRRLSGGTRPGDGSGGPPHSARLRSP